MDKNNSEPKIIIYEDKSILYDKNGNSSTFIEGKQTNQAKERYKLIRQRLENGFLEDVYSQINGDFKITEDKLNFKYKKLIDQLISTVTSEIGRALVVLLFIQLTVKAISPEQNIRLHKGSNSSKKFSWNEGISMRSLDSNYITPFLREKNLLKLNKYGAFMTRTLAENYPYSKLYKASIRGDKKGWIELVDATEENNIDALEALKYLISQLKNNSDIFISIANTAQTLAAQVVKTKEFKEIENIIFTLVETSNYKARIFEVAMHSLLEAIEDKKYLEGSLAPMTQMRSANKKHGNVGDIEVYDQKMLIESWDAKYGKKYLRDELEELEDKLEEHPDINVAGFVTDKSPQIDKEIEERKEEVEVLYNTSIEILSFKDWVRYEVKDIPREDLESIGKQWLIYFVEDLGQKRRKVAPIDEPTEDWLKEIIEYLKN